MKLCKLSGLYLAVALFSTAALAANTVQTGTLKDLQTVGTTSKKQKQQINPTVANPAVAIGPDGKLQAIPGTAIAGAVPGSTASTTAGSSSTASTTAGSNGSAPATGATGSTAAAGS